MMFIITLAFDIEVTFRCIGKRFKEMEKHFRWHFADFFTRKFYLPDDPVTAAKINQHFGIGVIHRQGKSVTFHSPFIGKYPGKCFPKCDTGILNGVVLIYMQIAFGND